MVISVVLADDHQVVRQGLRALLESEPDVRVVGEAADGLETVRLVNIGSFEFRSSLFRHSNLSVS